MPGWGADGPIMSGGGLAIISKPRCKASRFGGRPFALPSATASALAAARRRRGKAGRAPQLMDFAAEVRINGEPGLQGKHIFDKIMAHVCTNTGISLTAFEGHSNSRSGFWKHFASDDPAAPPGRARLCLSSQDEVAKIYAALHGQVFQVGGGFLSISVRSDLLDALTLSGNGGRVP